MSVDLALDRAAARAGRPERSRLAAIQPFLQLGCAAVAGALWDQDPSRTWVVGIALAPLALPLLARLRPIPRTPMDLPLGLWLLSGLVGVAVSYDPLGKSVVPGWSTSALYWLPGLVLALAVFYAVAAMARPAQLAWLLWLFSGLGVVGAAWYAVTNDWLANLARVPGGSGLAAALQGWSPPRLPIQEMNSNLIGSLLAILLFYGLAVTALGFRSRGRLQRLAWGWGGAAASLAMAAGLFLTVSRGAWLAAAGAGYLAAAWVITTWLARRRGWSARSQWAAAATLATLGVALAVALLYLVTPLRASLAAPGSSLAGREMVFQESLLIARDYLFTGSGPGTFPVIHFAYSLLVHVPVLHHAHNLWLQYLAEQGLLGLVAVCLGLAVPLVVGLRALLRARRINPLLLAGLASQLVIILHGLVEVPIHGNRSLLFFWVPAAIIVAASRNGRLEDWEIGRLQSPNLPTSHSPRRLSWPSLAALALIALALGVLLFRPAAAAFEANLGALAQTRVELAQYDYNHFADPTLHQVRQRADLSRAEAHYRRALAMDPGNVTAATRLAGIALDRGDYTGAWGLLAPLWDAGHRDRVTRLLWADTLVAMGRPDDAAGVARGLRYAADHLSIQAWSFKTDGDATRAAYAEAAASALR